MSAEKLSPRQQMIGIMYLVLLAMLAMNASKDLLNAFVALENGIGQTNKNFAAKNSKAYGVIQKAAGKFEAARKINVEAQKVKAQADKLFNIIEEDKGYMIYAMTGGKDDDSIPLGKDNQDKGAEYYIFNDAPNEKGDRLKKEMNVFSDLITKDLVSKKVLDAKADAPLLARCAKLLATKDSTDKDDVTHHWISLISEHLVLCAVTANLTLLQTYIRNAEAEVIETLAATIEGDGMIVNVANGMAVLNPGYVLTGDSIRGEIFIAAYNNNIVPEIYLGDVDTIGNKFVGGKLSSLNLIPLTKLFKGQAEKLPVGGGIGKYRKRAGSPGVVDVTGVISIPDKNGFNYYLYRSSYMVAQPSATVAATKMNVFYIGIDNPVSVSAPGVSLKDISVSAPGLNFIPIGKDGEYKVNPKTAGKIKVSVNKKGGATLGGMEFRVKSLPTPVAKILGKNGGSVQVGLLKAVDKVDAVMENFDFELKVTIASFDLTMNIKGDLKTETSKSNMLTAAMKSMLNGVAKGTKVYFENCKVTMPNGEKRSLGTLAFTAN
jgi:GldM C-terminal domain/GldM N-terminal domain